MSEVRKPKAGAIRWKDAIDHDFHVVEPGHESYGGALMCATEYWDVKSDEWKPLTAEQVANNA